MFARGYGGARVNQRTPVRRCAPRCDASPRPAGGRAVNRVWREHNNIATRRTRVPRRSAPRAMCRGSYCAAPHCEAPHPCRGSYCGASPLPHIIGGRGLPPRRAPVRALARRRASRCFALSRLARAPPPTAKILANGANHRTQNPPGLEPTDPMPPKTTPFTTRPNPHFQIRLCSARPSGLRSGGSHGGAAGRISRGGGGMDAR